MVLLFYSMLMSCWLTTFVFYGWDDFFPKYPVYTDDLTIALFDFQILKIMLLQNVDDTLSRMYSFQTFDYIDLPIFDDQFDGQEPLVPYHLQYLYLGGGQS